MITLYSYWRSTAAYRVRIALNLKGLDYRIKPVHLVRDGGEQHSPGYMAVNPQQLVPTLEVDGETISQSLAIMEWLEERHAEPALLPEDPIARARARQIALIVACEMHPLNNLRVLQYLQGPLGIDDAAKRNWYQHWVTEGFASVEGLLRQRAVPADYCVSAEPTIADICVVAQVFNAERFACNMAPFLLIRGISERCLALPAFDRARPENQPDAV